MQINVTSPVLGRLAVLEKKRTEIVEGSPEVCGYGCYPAVREVVAPGTASGRAGGGRESCGEGGLCWRMTLHTAGLFIFSVALRARAG